MQANQQLQSFAICPLRSGYTVQPSDNLSSQKLLGGPSRHRVDFINNVDVVNVSLMLKSEIEMKYFRAFYKLLTTKPQDFLWKIKQFSDPDFKTVLCTYVPDSMQDGGRPRNGMQQVSFTIEIQDTGLGFDSEVFLHTYTTTNGNPYSYFNLLERLVNVDLPQAMEGLT